MYEIHRITKLDDDNNYLVTSIQLADPPLFIGFNEATIKEELADKEVGYSFDIRIPYVDPSTIPTIQL